MESALWRRSLRDPLVRNAVAIGLAVGAFGVSFGAMASAAGVTAPQAVASSLLVFTGASQFAFVGVLAAGGGLLAALLPAAVLAVRNCLYGISLAPVIDGPLTERLALSHLVIDESTAMARAQPGRHTSRRALVVTGISVLVLWTLGTGVGVLSSRFVGDPRSLGLDAMFPAAFLALLGPQLGRHRARPVALCGGVMAVTLVPVAPPGVPIVVAALAVGLGLLPRATHGASR